MLCRDPPVRLIDSYLPPGGFTLLEYTKCALCGELLGDGEIVATTHFIGDRNDPLWRFSDASMHYECFQRWLAATWSV